MKPGLRLTERYRLMERLDDGDAMEVWRAWDEALSRSVAVKLPDPARLADTVRGRGFHELASRAAGVRHAGFAAIYDCDQTHDAAGRTAPYLVTEYLEGETLAARVERAPLPTAEALEICARVATALSVAHRDGVPHGDLSPRRIFLTPGGVKIVDVGVGAVLRAASGHPSELPEPVADTAPATLEDQLASDKADDVRAFGALLTACLDAGASAAPVPDEITILRYECRASDPLERPPMSRVADVLARVTTPPASARNELSLATLFGGGDATQPPDPDREVGHDEHRTEFLAAPPPPEEPYAVPHAAPHSEPPPDRRPVLITAVIIAVAATITAVLVGLNRPSSPPQNVAAPQPPPASAPPATPSEPSTPSPEPSDSEPPAPTTAPPATRRAVDTSTLGVLGRLQPIVDGGQASGRIRSDVAVDLNNLINNLRNELATGRAVDVDARVAELRRKIDTRLRERALTADAAAELTGVLDQHGG